MTEKVMVWMLAVIVVCGATAGAAERTEQVRERIVVEGGKKLELEGNVRVRGNVTVKRGILAVGDHTLTVEGSVRLPGDPGVGNISFGKKGSLAFVGESEATLDLGAVGTGYGYNTAVRKLVVDKPGARLVVSGSPLVVRDSLDRRAGSLEMERGGAVWMGVSRGGPGNKRTVDVALKLTQEITPELAPEVTPAPVPEMEPGKVRVIHNEVGPEVPGSVDLVNIADRADIRTVPYMTMARTMVDQDPRLRTVVAVERGVPAGGTRYEFRFDGPRKVAAIRWAVVAGPWALLADSTGDGVFDRVLRVDLAGKLSNPGGVWRSRSRVENRFWPAVEAHAVKLVSLLGRLRNNRIYDFQILCPAATVATEEDPGLDEDVPVAEAGPRIDPPAPPPDEQFMQGFHIETWMLGHVRGWMKEEERKPFGETKGFGNFMDGLRGMGGNTVNLWPPKTFESKGPGTYESDLLWPSRYDRHSVEENILKLICEALQKQNVNVFTMLRVPYPKKLEEFPEESRSGEEAPFIDRHAREYMAGITREQVRSGVDGVGVGFDEQANWKAAGYCAKADAATRKAFEEQHGMPVPDAPADTEAFRRWMIFAYEQFASYLAQAAGDAKRTRPDVFTHTATHVQLGSMWNERIRVGIAGDIVGRQANLDFVRAYCYNSLADLGHYHFAANAERARAANPRGVISLHNCPWANDPEKYPGYYRDFTPAYMAAPPVLAVMHGADVPLYWRYNFAYYGGYDTYVEQAYSILNALAGWGGKEATTPRSIAVLKSRASEDWWQVRRRYGEDADPMDQTRGYLYEKWLQELLLSGGYPYDMYFLDQPGSYSDELSEYDLIVLPFPYSVSSEAFGAVRDAAASGSRVLILGRQGETDEWGVPRDKPLFAGMIAEQAVQYVADDVTEMAHSIGFNRRIRKTIDDLLGEAKPLFFDARGQDVEAALLERGADTKFLCLVNWMDRPVEVEVGLKLPAGGAYEVLERNRKDARAVTIDGRRRLSDRDLRRVRVPMEKWQIKLLYVHPAGED